MKPIVVGSPRSGFALLCSVLSHLQVMRPRYLDRRQRLLRIAATGFGHYISKAIDDAFYEAGVGEGLIFNDNFRQLLGGPKWLHDNRADTACVRKYLGVRGLGDFTLIINHPRAILECDDIIHSHIQPVRWLEEPGYKEFTKLASVRNPIGIINSSILSINALTSEYIQRYLPPEEDNHQLREQLALYKFTDLDFFKGIASFYKRFFDEFLPVRDRYIVMRWENLIVDPVGTIVDLAKAIDLPVDEEHAAQIWHRLDHVNLTGAHQHNLRKGGGKVGDWKNWMVNEHLQIIEEFGFAPIIEELGYQGIPELDESSYTPFQQQVSGMLSEGKIFPKYKDRDLFEFAFNKSNLDSEKFTFKRYDEREHTKVERSSFKDEDTVFAVWEKANQAAGELNHFFDTILSFQYESSGNLQGELTALGVAAEPLQANMPKAHESVMDQLLQFLEEEGGKLYKPSTCAVSDPQPRLVRAFCDHNIVSYLGKFYCIPHNTGPVDLASQSVDDLPGAFVTSNYRDAVHQVKVKSGNAADKRREEKLMFRK
ncbi:MAG: hypothetical protein CMM60_03185 [Rhodospirillaceae bacterium]|nr:hypothetical protein [Rhodospirillaceae bacterium]